MTSEADATTCAVMRTALPAPRPIFNRGHADIFDLTSDASRRALTLRIKEDAPLQSCVSPEQTLPRR